MVYILNCIHGINKFGTSQDIEGIITIPREIREGLDDWCYPGCPKRNSIAN
jgi:hypothetical protein